MRVLYFLSFWWTKMFIMLKLKSIFCWTADFISYTLLVPTWLGVNSLWHRFNKLLKTFLRVCLILTWWHHIITHNLLQMSADPWCKSVPKKCSTGLRSCDFGAHLSTLNSLSQSKSTFKWFELHDTVSQPSGSSHQKVCFHSEISDQTVGLNDGQLIPADTEGPFCFKVQHIEHSDVLFCIP